MVEVLSMEEVETFWATIYVGFRVGSLDEPERKYYTTNDVWKICSEYCDRVGLCVTITPTEYVYKGGSEKGAAIGLINYPRFPKMPKEIEDQAITLAGILREKLDQFKVSIVIPHKTVMIGEKKH